MKIIKYLIITFVSILILIAISIPLLNNFLVNTIENQLIKANSKNLTITPGAIEIDILKRNIKLKNTKINYVTVTENGNVILPEIHIYGIQPNSYKKPDSITIDSLTIVKALYSQKKQDSINIDTKTKKSTLPYIAINSLKIIKAKHIVQDKNSDTTLHTKSLNLTISKLNYNTNSKEKIAIDSYSYDIDSIHTPLDDFEKLYIENIKGDSTTMKITNLQIRPTYSKEEMSALLKKEKDWIDLKVRSLVIHNQKLNFKDETIQIKADSIEIDNAKLSVYRDKQIADDHSYKPLYSKKLRELNFPILIPKIKLNNGSIEYEERIQNNGKPGMITFTELKGTIYDINNTGINNNTTIDLTTKFMGHAPFTFHWNFNIADKTDYFKMKGELHNLTAASINQFTLPNLNVQCTGHIDHVYFDISANDYKAQGKYLMDYKNFKIEIEKKNENQINKFLSNIANIFIKTNKDNLKEVHIDVKRDPEKSFFNFLWLCVKQGTLHSVT
ncbi:hypothetical protein [Robertkochia solimangrovi]|uniref:hypothetical protein n=1 Tax=Robertkochia solimangrovi TaxID=2213046 RepID=UPI00117E4CF7|nr:hypothetical protein [Robertkochia solimangrovi]TRZ46063.1 hypothetical protein DMZ48_01980 [Robertkochia solimangrovi]